MSKEQADQIKREFERYVSWGYGQEDASKIATENHNGGFEVGQYGGKILAYCGDYVVLFTGRGEVYKKMS